MSIQSARSASRSAKPSLRESNKTPSRKSAPKKPVRTTGKVSIKAAKTAGRPSGAAAKRAVPAEALIRPLSVPVAPPVATISLPRRLHKYQVGDAVYYTSPSFGRAAATGSYLVVKLLPSESDDYQYRIKSTGEAFERVARESQLERA